MSKDLLHIVSFVTKTDIFLSYSEDVLDVKSLTCVFSVLFIELKSALAKISYPENMKFANPEATLDLFVNNL